MRVILIAAFLTILTVSAHATRCYSKADCKEGECCTGGISPYIKGECKPFGTEGKLCDPQPPVIEKYFLYCPCETGLKCVGEEKVISSTSPVCKVDE